MAGVKTLADGNVAFFLLPTAPDNPDAITVAEIEAGINYSKQVLASDFDLGPTGSDSIAEKDLAARGNAQVFGPSNYGGGFTAFRYFDPETGLADEDDDSLFAAVKTKGTTLHVVTIENAKDAIADRGAGEEYRYYEVLTDDPVRGERTGFQKMRINTAVQRAALDKKIVAPGG